MNIQSRTERILVEIEGAVATIVFNKPEKHNAVDKDMWLAAATAITAAGNDPNIRAIVLTGAGDKAFVAGADISRFEDERAEAEAVEAYARATDAFHQALLNVRKPTIARINGYCIGGGMAIALDCDLRIATDMSRFAVPAAKLGLGYAHDGIRRLTKIVGPAFAAEIFYTARQFDAEEARIMGLVNRVAPVDEFDAYLAGYLDRIAGNAPLTLASVKQTLIELSKPDAERDLDLCDHLVKECFESDDYKEGRQAFMEKRKPQFRGR